MCVCQRQGDRRLLVSQGWFHCVCWHVREVDLWVTDRRESGVLAVSITEGLMRRDATRQNWGGGVDASIQSEATMGGGKPLPSQATLRLAVTAEVSKVDARFATRHEVFGFASAQRDMPPAPLLSIPAVGQCHPSLHKRSFSLSPRANMSAWRARASRGSSRHGLKDFHAARKAADNVIEINPAPATRAFLLENRQRKGKESKGKERVTPPPTPGVWWIYVGCLLQNVLNAPKCQKETLSSVRHTESTHFQSESAVNQPRLTVFSSFLFFFF